MTRHFLTGFVCAVLGLISAPSWAQQAATNCAALKQIGSIKLSRGDTGLWLVPAAINGQAKQMLLATGVPSTSITPDTVAALKLEPFQRPGLGATPPGASKPFGFVHLQSLALGTAGQFSNSDFIIAGDEGGRPLPPTAPAGNLGLDLLSHFDFDLDFSTGTLNLFSQDHCDGQVVYWKNDGAVAIPFVYDMVGRIRIPVKLDGMYTSATISTGHDANIITLGQAESVLKYKAQESERVDDPSSPFANNYRHRFGILELEGLQIRDTALQIADIRSGKTQNVRTDALNMRAAVPADINLGMGTLSKLHIYVATKEKKLYISTASPAP